MRRLTEVDFDERSQRGGPDECWLWTGGRAADGYGAFRRGRYAHQHAFEREHGTIPAGQFVDHVCRNRLCVNPTHLRLATNQQNSCNAGPRRGSSAFKGVSRSSKRALLPWQASIKLDGKSRHLGTFATEQAAAAAYDAAALAAWGEFAYLNGAAA